MEKLKVKDLVKASGGILVKGNGEKAISGASIDTRTLKEGDVFFAIKGENTDGHRFIQAAFEKNCSAVVIEDEKYKEDVPDDKAVVLVSDTQKALAKTAAWYRKKLDIKIIGVTGSVGKTSTSDLVKAVCEVKFKTAKTKGNFNNHLGLPLTLLSFEPDTEAGILEMGMDRPGEISYLVSLAKPDIGLITNIGTAHIEYLKTRENIFRAKMEITDCFTEKSTLVVNGDDDYLSTVKTEEYSLITAGTESGCSIRTDNILSGEEGVCFDLSYKGETVRVDLPVPGRHNAINAGLAAGAGIALGMTLDEIREGLSKAALTDRRLSVKTAGGIKVIDDTYNASPASMKAAIDVLCETSGTRKVAILGDMYEQGENSRQYHREIGEYAGEKDVDVVVCIGEFSEYIKFGALAYIDEKNVLYYKTRDDFYSDLKKTILPGDAVLVKGSRGMAMEEIVKKILE